MQTPAYDIRNLRSDNHDDVIKWKHLPRFWNLVMGNHRKQVESLTKASDAELWCFLWCAFEEPVKPTVELPVIWYAITLMWRHCDDTLASNNWHCTNYWWWWVMLNKSFLINLFFQNYSRYLTGYDDTKRITYMCVNKTFLRWFN